LKQVYHEGKVEEQSEGVILDRSKVYDFSNVTERGEWFDVFVTLIQYLLSGDSKVGFLNNNHPWNLIHKVPTSFPLTLFNVRKIKLNRKKERK
jgi:hypothetical protein